MDLKPLPIAAALVGGGGLALIAGSASVASVNAFAPAGLAVGAGIAALAIAKPGNGEALRAFGYGGLAIGGLLAWAGYQAYQMQKSSGTTAQATHGNLNHMSGGNLAPHMAGADLVNIVGSWIEQNVAPPQQGGLSNWAYNQAKHDMTGRRAPAAWGGKVRGTSRAGW